MRIAIAVVAAVAVLSFAASASANSAPGAAWGYAAATPCPNPVCKPVCKPSCKVSTTSCSNSTTTTSVCNFKCTVPEEATKVVVTPIPFHPQMAGPAPMVYGRKLQNKKDFVMVSNTPSAPKMYEAVVHKAPAPVTPPPKPAPLPVCSQSCTNVTGYVYTCAPKSCTKLVDKEREASNCTIQCETPKAVAAVATPAVALATGRKLQGEAPKDAKDASYSYTPVAYSDIPNAPAVPKGEVAPVCQQVCVVYKEKYQVVECVSDECKTESCTDTDCSCPSPKPPSPPEKKDDAKWDDDKWKDAVKDIPIIGGLLGGFGNLFG